MADARQALQSREAAAMSAWVVFQRNVARLSIAAICALAAMEPIRREDGSFDPRGGLGRPLAQSTTYRWLAQAREQFRDEYLRRPVLDMVMEEDDRLEHLAAEWANEARMLPLGSARRFDALDRYLRVLESRRKLLGLDQPTRLEVVAEVTNHDDPASTRLAEAMADAKARRDAILAELGADTDG
jgi:hypothetical protein